MQIEHLNEAQTFLDIKGKMTCNEMNEASSLGQNAEPAAHVTNDELDDYKFEGINLEDDIEKVELSSPESSDLSEDGLAHFGEFSKNTQFLMDQPQVASQELRNWLIKIKEMQDTICKKMQMEQQANAIQPTQSKTAVTGSTSSTPNRVMKYQDLPYMGEITLNNSKPRRGRKPKKADICHLIYKNYGTILPGTPNASEYIEQSKKSPLDKDLATKNNLQNRYVSSLLEKRLTQHTNNKVCNKKAGGVKRTSIEPINLCVRDLDQLKIKLTKNSDDTYSTHIKSEPQSDNESDISNENTNSLNQEYGVPQFLLKDSTSNENHSPTHGKSTDTPPFGFWSNENTLMSPLGLQEQLMYYQGLAAMNNLSVHNPRPPPDIIPIESKSRESGKMLVKIKPKELKSSEDPTKTSLVKMKRSTSDSGKTPAKRKRSAIFIPPISTENNANPATEVSICKFKFTGGAKPKLQEKKMLSVDSGGNFRYYSGTGDKSMRGYEFFPRETLQQTANATQGSSTGAFLQASGEKIFPLNDLNETQVKSEFLLSPEIPTTSTNNSNQELSLRHKKRKSRKSIQREKLEQTFREKGFLIQTQQLQSAEGATYCKFRQLRKFTRYLFRSWKDYLPGNVREIQENGRNEQECENLSNISAERS
ncbi:hypothetical protein WA026_019243 [Henosepilachna vigintioctopunctata]